jgi:CMP-N-acetylneuraminic acid synthetase
MNSIRHIALIPAKLYSSRCFNKNWKHFVKGKNLVEYTLDTITSLFFNKIIVSTDNSVFRFSDTIQVHVRPSNMATKESPINDLIELIINENKFDCNTYIWLLNPTSPFRSKIDFYSIKEMIENHYYESVTSVTDINPFLWKDNKPLFDTAYPRKNTQDFNITYAVENGQFIIFNVDTFIRTKSWYSENKFIFHQRNYSSMIDIDTEEDFVFAQKIGEILNED